MLIIVAHHYVVNSGLTDVINTSNIMSPQSLFLLLFGWGGKTGINCFIMITGYFMCKSKITVKKFVKLICWAEFYKVIFYLIFTLSGYQSFGVKTMIKALLPISSVSSGFTSAYLLFYLFIPFLNVLINAMSKKQHLILIYLCVFTYTVLAALTLQVVFNYITWFSVIYLIASYIRLYPKKWFDSKKLWGVLLILTVILSWCSVIVIAWLMMKLGKVGGYYFFVNDSNKPLALAASICLFMFFKNLNIGYIKTINTIAASAFGVLLIHANSDTMRQWLWKDTLNNVGMFGSPYLYIHAVCSVLGIYIICTLIDMLRMNLIEKPIFKYLNKKGILN